MKKVQKQILLECLESLREAHDEITGALRQQNPLAAQNMLAECQQLAVSVGENIEKLEGDGHKTVSCLEEYCELLYQLSVWLDEGSLDEVKASKLLRRQLITIENSIKNDISVRKEVVFLPYKASMWDSMESVWMAARDDPDCDEYVVAIPYFERNRDESLGRMHYEGGEYPYYVPITDWQEYDLEKRRPDIIYIQNPYDDENYVTCVPRQYFSRELKKYTETLVYLPYFVGIGGSMPEHFCLAPGVRNADRVIVESEEIKKIYIRSIRKFERENHCQGIFGNLDRKIQPLGSPKLERIRRMMESGGIDVPEEWRTKIYGRDGARKKVVLYNTTVNALLDYDDLYIEKMKRVLDIFRQEEDITLLWRPHPLFETTIRSMRPELYMEYADIVNQYRNEGWGIFDLTFDIDRAILLSDAYYGDMSSVVELYRVTGKPMMIQDCTV